MRTWSKFSTTALLTGSDFYLTIVGRLYHLMLLPWGLAGALAGLVAWTPRSGRIVADAWLAAMLFFVLVMGEVNFTHEYYQLPLVPLAALYFAAVAAPLFAGPWTLIAGKGLARALVMTLIGVAGFYYSGVLDSHYRRGRMDVRSFLAGRAVGRTVPGDALIVAVDEFGVTSPFLLYFSHLKGWSLGVEDLSPHVIEGFVRQGARYFATTVWPRIEAARSETAWYLTRHPRVEVAGAPEDVVIFDIGAPPR